ncbi:MAG TPA: hypothetical protein VFE50_08515, partial [Cyclobacteriaceae bacterium]|nr:hypothetical protein [Cyclobacteriaceae bacterium]
MSSQEDELKKYLAKRERKKNRKHVAEYDQPKASSPDGKRDPASFSTFFELSGGRSRLTTSVIVTVVLC